MIELLTGLAGVSVSATSILLGTLLVLTLLSAALGQSSGRRSRSGASVSSHNNNITSKLDEAPSPDAALHNNNNTNKNNNSGKASATAQTERTNSATVSVAKGSPPGPIAWPVIGSLHLIAKYEVPFEAFTALSNIYGDIFSITLGTTPCVVVNSFPLIKEVLITKGPHFGGRPNFIRYDILFGGDRDNCKLPSVYCFIDMSVYLISLASGWISDPNELPRTALAALDEIRLKKSSQNSRAATCTHPLIYSVM